MSIKLNPIYYTGSKYLKTRSTRFNLEALLWINVLPDKPVTVESKSLLSVQAINKMKHNQLEVGHLIYQCCSILCSKTSVSVVFIIKQVNKLAHLLAKQSCTINSFVDAHLLAKQSCMINSFVDFQSRLLSMLKTLLSNV